MSTKMSSKMIAKHETVTHLAAHSLSLDTIMIRRYLKKVLILVPSILPLKIDGPNLISSHATHIRL